MKVKALVPHTNVYGDAFAKAVGDVYELPDALGRTLIESEVVASADPLDHDGDGRKGGSKPPRDAGAPADA